MAERGQARDQVARTLQDAAQGFNGRALVLHALASPQLYLRAGGSRVPAWETLTTAHDCKGEGAGARWIWRTFCLFDGGSAAAARMTRQARLALLSDKVQDRSKIVI